MHNIIYSTIYGTTSRAVLFFISAISARLLLPEDYGLLSYILGIIGSLATISAFGSGTATNIAVAQSTNSNHEFAKKVIFSSLVISSAACTALCVAFLPFFITENSTITKIPSELYIFTALIIWLLSTNGITEGSLNGAGKYRNLAINSFFVFIISTPISLFLIWKHGLYGALTSILIYRIALLSLNICSMRNAGILRLNFHPKVIMEKPIREMLTSISLPSLLGALMVAPVIALSMRMILSQADGLDQLAYFSWVYQIYLIAVFIPSTLGGYFLSRFSRKGSESPKLIKMLSANVLFSLIVVMLLFLLKPVILKFPGELYISEASEIFNLLIPTVILYSANAIFSSYWPSKGRAWFGLIVNAAWASIILCTTWALVDTNGGKALATAFLTAYSVLLIIQIAAAKYLQRKPTTSAQHS